MKTGIKTAISIITIISLLLGMLSGCGINLKRNIIGKWYNEKGKCLDIRSDGTYKLEGDYGTGTWKLLDDKKTYEFLDYYGDSKESILNTDDFGIYIDLGNYGNFYKNSYPSINELTDTEIFDNVEISIKGASPYCYVSVNTDNCSDFIHKNINFYVEDGFYKNGDSVTVYASTDGETQKSKKFPLSNAAEFVASTDDLDINFIEKEFEKYLNNQKRSAEIGEGEFFGSDDILQGYKLTVKGIELIESGFFSIKPEMMVEFSKNPYANCYNAFYHIYGIEVINGNNNQKGLYIGEIMVRNITKNFDGSTSWNVYAKETDIGELTGSLYTGISDYNRYGSGFPAIYKSERYTYNIIKKGNYDLIKQY